MQFIHNVSQNDLIENIDQCQATLRLEGSYHQITQLRISIGKINSVILSLTLDY